MTDRRSPAVLVAPGTIDGARVRPARHGLHGGTTHTATRRRLDLELVRRGLAPSRAHAQELLAAGRVTVGGAPAAKAARLVAGDEPVLVLGPPEPYVGRGGRKLEGALDRFGIAVAGVRALDAGASTGGFTDCLLQRGARQVWAIDVGHGQLHPRIRNDDRVVVREGCNVRSLTAEQLGGPVEVCVADLSFIALRTVAPALVALTAPGGTLVVLVKPQFEAGRVEAARARGIITDPVIWRRVLGEVTEAFALAGAGVLGVAPSPLRGGDGNVEFLLHLGVGAAAAPDLDALLDAAVAEVAPVAEVAEVGSATDPGAVEAGER